MRTYIFFLGLLMSFALASAQNEQLKYDRVWVLSGGNIEMHFDSSNYSMVLNKPVNISMDFAQTSICNRQGQLQLMTDGFLVQDSNRDTVLYPINTADYNYPDNVQYNMGQAIAKANVFVEDPADSNRYYLLHSEIDFDAASATYDAYMPHLYYTHIDMSNGTGTLLQSKKVLLDGTVAKKLLPCTITACRHANGRDWWVLVFRRFSKNYCRFLVSPAGIQNLGWTTDVDVPNANFIGGVGGLLFSPDGSKAAFTSDSSVLFLWDFDRCTGTLSNLKTWNMKVDSVSAGFTAFSPNSRFLYLTFSSGVYLYQLDLQAPDPFASRKVVAVYDGYTINGFRGDFFMMQLAPDNRIYAATGGGEQFLHVINHPDSLGIACDVKQHCILLPTANGALPNLPSYRLGALVGSGCDTIGTSTTKEVIGSRMVRVYPNPANDQLTLAYSIDTNAHIVLYDMLGRSVLSQSLLAAQTQAQVSVSHLPAGIYTYALVTENGITALGKISVQH